MAWQPPTGWRDWSYEQRVAYLRQFGLYFPSRTSDWDVLEYHQQAAYRDWLQRLMFDTPEAREAKRREYVRQLQVWWLVMGWWTLCLVVVLGLLWWRIPGADVIVRVGLMVFTVVAYIFAVYIPTSLVKPTPPRE